MVRLKRLLPRNQTACETALIVLHLFRFTADVSGVTRFQWVFCQLEVIRKCPSADAVREALDSLPKSLDDTYNRILSSIDDENREDVLRILQWLCFSARPVRLDQMVEVLAVEVGQLLQLNPVRRLRNLQDIVALCPTLLCIARRSLDYWERQREFGENVLGREEVEEIKLAHLSVKEYLVSGRIRAGPTSIFDISEKSANLSIAVTCLVYLLHFDVLDLTPDAPVEFPLIVYAAEHWVQHYKAAEANASTARLDDLIVDLLATGGKCFLNWRRLYDFDCNGQRFNFTKENGQSCFGDGSPLYYASFLGLHGVVNRLLVSGVDINAQGGRHGNALQAAIHGDHENVVKLLLNNGAKIIMQRGECSGTPGALDLAVERGHDKIVEMLLSNGVDVDAQESYHSSPLMSASRNGHVQIVKSLLARGAHVQEGRTDEYTALAAASGHGHMEVVKLLVAHGADVNLRGYYCGAPLRAASSRGEVQMVKFLIANGADVNAVEAYGLTPLHAASGAGHEHIVMLLLDNGAYVNMDRERGGPLQHASKGGHENIVKLLLERGAEIDANCKSMDSALQLACYEGHERTIKLLLDNGADINKAGYFHGAALQAAATGTHSYPHVVKLLLDNGANVNGTGGIYRGALQAASTSGNRDIVELLLEKGADINMGVPHRTALKEACDALRDDIIKLLIERGANIHVGVLEGVVSQLTKFPSHTNGVVEINRLQYEARARLLLEKGAVATSDALELAAGGGLETLVKLLLYHGAVVTTEAVKVATRGGHETVVRLLLARMQKFQARL